MKFESSSAKEIQQVGEVENNNIGIDTNNIDFIVTILSTNLYSKPIESFIRETVSNAWDSHVEAGVTDPVVLELGQDTEGNYFCRIQDFGVGLSKERFDKIYKNIGSSTKRGSNDQIGGFGIGRFAALAYSEVVHITSIFDGLKCRYLMYKDGNTISIDLIHEEMSTERNGVEVQVPVQSGSDLYSFESAVKKQLSYFENLFVSSNIGFLDIANDFNSFKIKKFNNFSVNTLVTDRNIKLILGKVVYPLRTSSLDKSYAQRIQNLPIAVNFEIGDIEVTPNREEIQYSKKNIAVIEAKLDDAIEEVDELILQNSKKDFSIISDYVQALDDKKIVTLYENVTVATGKQQLNYTYKGCKYDDDTFKHMFNEAMSVTLLKTNYVVDNGKLRYKNQEHSLNVVKNEFDDFLICDVATLNNMSKNYLREEHDGKIIFPVFGDVKKYFIKYAAYLRRKAENSGSSYRTNYHSYSYDHRITKLMFRLMCTNLSLLKTFGNHNVPQSYIDKKKAEAKAKRLLRKTSQADWSQNISLGVLRYSSRSTGSVTSDSATYNLKELADKKKLCIYGEKNHSKLRALHLLTQNKINCYEIAPSRLKLVKDINNFVKFEDFIMNIDYKLIRNIATSVYIQKTIPFLSELISIGNLREVSEKVDNAAQEIYSFMHKYGTNYNGGNRDAVDSLREEIYNLALEKNYFNEEMRALVDSNIDLLDKARCLTLFVEMDRYGSRGSISKEKVNLAVDYILARKIFRPSLKAVIKLKKETIFNIKPVENEDN